MRTWIKKNDTQILSRSTTLLAVTLLQVGFFSQAIAQTNTSAASLGQVGEKSVGKNFSIALGLEAASNFYSEESPDRQTGTSFTLGPSYKFRNGIGLASETTIDRDEVKAGETKVSNTAISLSKSLGYLVPAIEAKVALGGVAPTNADDRKEKSYQGGASIGGQLVGTFKYVVLTYKLKLSRNFHGYTHAADGSSNIQYGLSNTLVADIDFLKTWTLSLSGVSKAGWVYQGSNRQTYGNEISLSNQITKEISISAGLRNEGSAFKSDGVTNNVKILDNNTTMFFASLNITQ